MFDLNDFDETLPGPFEYDVQRMAASFTIAARNNGLTTKEATSATLKSVRAYREAMAWFAQMGVMELWYTHMSAADIEAGLNKLSQRSPTRTKWTTRRSWPPWAAAGSRRPRVVSGTHI